MKLIRTLKFQEIYAQEKVTKVDSLSLVLSGKWVFTKFYFKKMRLKNFNFGALLSCNTTLKFFPFPQKDALSSTPFSYQFSCGIWLLNVA